MSTTTTTHPKACVCSACCKRRGGRDITAIATPKPVRFVKMYRKGDPRPAPRTITSKPSGARAGQRIADAGKQATRLVYGTAFSIILLFAIYAIVSASIAGR